MEKAGPDPAARSGTWRGLTGSWSRTRDLKEPLRAEGAGVHQRAQVTAQVGPWPEGPQEDEWGHSAGESRCVRVCYWAVPCCPTCLLWAAGSRRVLPPEPGTDQTPGGEGSASSQPASGARTCPADRRPQGVLRPAGLRARLACGCPTGRPRTASVQLEGTRGSASGSVS